MQNHDAHIGELRCLFEDALASCKEARYPGQDPTSLAIRYVLSNGGKRVRPLLCLLAAEALGAPPRQALSAALAVEFVHTYSLVHDDLPCMDDDATRRGKPTAHMVFGQAHALLAGDALLTDAFSLLVGEEAGVVDPLSPTVRLAMVRELAAAAGGGGMVLGQSLDLHWTARRGAGQRDLDQIHAHKTGDLLGASTALGALAAGCDASIVTKFREFGRLSGLAFQILDDVLDESGATGKSPGKDKAAGKLTYLSVMSPDVARAAAEEYTTAAVAKLAEHVPHSALIPFVLGLLGRTS